MARGTERPARDPHQRFSEWLETITEDDPPRDLAVHAAVCAGCQQRIAAIDMLTAVDPALAGIPQVGAVPAPAAWLLTTGRAAVMVGGVAALVAVGIGSWRFIQASGLAGETVESPTQAVLGGTGAPEATSSPSAPPSLQQPSSDASPSGAQPTAQPPSVVPPTAIAQPTPPPLQPTARPTAHPTATPRTTRTPAPTAVPTPVPTPVVTPTPTPEPPTPVPTP